MNQECERCDAAEMGGPEGHFEWELIEVDDKYFCPYTLQRVRPFDEWEEMGEEEQGRLAEENERVVLITPAVYKVITGPKSTPERDAKK